jgi:hypothetical protein
MNQENECVICSHSLDRPVTCRPCGHRFCGECLKACARVSQICPICHNRYTHVQVHQGMMPTPFNTFRQMPQIRYPYGEGLTAQFTVNEYQEQLPERESSRLAYVNNFRDNSQQIPVNIPTEPESDDSTDEVHPEYCMICEDHMDRTVQCQPCGHEFCAECLRACGKMKTICPKCRHRYSRVNMNRMRDGQYSSTVEASDFIGADPQRYTSPDSSDYLEGLTLNTIRDTRIDCL